jgi:putative FmdB family regulatory protein
MPTYEFRCPNGHGFDRFYKTISAAPTELPCPECGLVAARQLSGGAGFVFKGSGFYLTDYGKNAHRGGKSDSGKPEGGKAEGGKSGSGKAESGKSDTAKPDTAKPEVSKPAAAKPDTPKPKKE